MMDDIAASSFLPTIKCSMCAQDIEISQMGDHVCPGPGEATPPPDTNSSFDKLPYKQTATNGPGFLKPGRAIPPRVDTSAANRPFFPEDQLTPVSASPSRSTSPNTPSGGRKSPLGRPLLLRSSTAPLNGVLPSPEAPSSNLDCAFPPFPIPRPTQSNHQGGHGRLGSRYAGGDPMYAPVSPRTASSGGLLQRMNTIAPGPFDINRRRNVEGSDTARGRRKGSSENASGMPMSPSEAGNSISRPATTDPGHSRTSTNSSHGSKSENTVPKLPRKNGYDGFGPPGNDEFPQPERLSPDNKSQTFPLRSVSQEPSLRRPSEAASDLQDHKFSTQPRDGFGGSAGLRPNGLAPKRPQPSISGPDLTRPLPPRGASLIKPREDSIGVSASNPTNLNLAAEFGIGNPYHTPTDSQSSSASGYSDQSKASSRSSPPLSTRQPSDATKMDVLMADLESSMSELEPQGTMSDTSPPRERAQYPRVLQPPQRLDQAFLSAESPMDSAVKGGRFSSFAQNENRSLSPSRDTSPQEKPRSLSPARSTPPAEKPRRPATSKGNCKGCGVPIKGKSVSSADGRLTGRYHKDCFVCNTCSEPFQTATFYVLKDAPYCERHYHKLNGSVCKTCDKGIEGQYLESEDKQKFHPPCLTCADCKRNLRNDYFEMNGRVYCERDAFRRTQQTRFLGPAAGSNRMERRTTRLMMM